MSYSTYMYLFGFKLNKEFILKYLNKAIEMYKLTSEPMPDIGYWERTRDDYETFEDHIQNQIIQDWDETKEMGRIFLFCNHDGVTDEEVFQAYLKMGKILSYELGCHVYITSNIDKHDDEVYNIFSDVGCLKSLANADEFQKEMEIIYAKGNLAIHKKGIKDCEKIIKEKKEG